MSDRTILVTGSAGYVGAHAFAIEQLVLARAATSEGTPRAIPIAQVERGC